MILACISVAIFSLILGDMIGRHRSKSVTKYKRLPWPRTLEIDDKPEDPKKPETKEEKEARIAKIKEMRSLGAALKRAHDKLDEFMESDTNTETIVNQFVILYGKDEDGHKDVRAFAEFGSGAFALCYGRADATHDELVFFEKADIFRLREILDRQDKK